MEGKNKMKQYLYLVISTDANGKKAAYAHKLPVSDNLFKLKSIPHADIIITCPTWKQARETAERWNAIYKANGTYSFGDPALF